MFVVYRWFRDDDEDFTEIVGVFSNQYEAEHYQVFYAMLHMINVDDLMLGYKENVSLEKLINEVMDK